MKPLVLEDLSRLVEHHDAVVLRIGHIDQLVQTGSMMERGRLNPPHESFWIYVVSPEEVNWVFRKTSKHRTSPGILPAPAQ